MPPPLPRRSVWAYRFAHFIQTYQSSPIGLSGRPAHCPFRGLLGVHSRCGLHTRAVTNLRHANRRLQPLRYLHDCSDCFRLERLPGGACTHWKAPPLHGAHPQRTSANHFNVRQSPALVEDRFLRAVHTKPRKPFLSGLGVEPVGCLTCGWLRAKVDVHRSIGVLAQILVERTERKSRRVEKEARRFQTIDGCGPELTHRHIRRNAQPLGVPAFHSFAAVVVKRSKIETAGAKLLRWTKILRQSDPSGIHTKIIRRLPMKCGWHGNRRSGIGGFFPDACRAIVPPGCNSASTSIVTSPGVGPSPCDRIFRV